jgi:hypothetical protein
MDFVLSFLLGVFWFVLFGEYLLHRLVFHGRVSSWLRLPPIMEHKRHHASNFFAPFWIKAYLVVPLMFTFAALIVSHLPLFGLNGVAFAAGVTVSYAALELLHYSFHNTAPSTSVGLFFRKHHFAHHFESPASNFGFAGGILLDLAFGTFVYARGVVAVSPGYHMAWLHDGKTVKPEFAAHFRLKS